MKRIAVALVLLLGCMTLSSAMGSIVASNDIITESGQKRGLSVDGFVETKLASVGTAVQILAHTRGHTDNTQVTADILYYPQEPIEFLTEGALPEGHQGVWEASLTLQKVGEHPEDSNTWVWEGSYIVPINSIGGVFGARVIAEDGNLRATDDPNQLRELFLSEVEKLLQSLDDAWDTNSPADDIKTEFDELENTATSNGDWTDFVDIATDGNSAGDAGQLWNSMIDAGHNQYNMSEGATFLEYLMEFLDSEDVDAGLAFIGSLLIYVHEFPIPRTFEDLPPLVDHIQAFDPIENFTRFEGTGDFEAAYNALLGSNEWSALEDAFDNLINGEKEFESVQTILHNIALLSVSVHPEAIIQGMDAYFGSLENEDIDNATPFQKLLVGWAGMFEKFDEETDFQDTDGDEIPDNIIFEYEKLLDTPEGQAWTTKMASSGSSSYVNDAFDEFNQLPEDIIQHIIDSIFLDIANEQIHPLWEDVGETAEELGEWIEMASFSAKEDNWHKQDCDSESTDDDGDDGDEEPCYDTPYFEEFGEMKTSLYDPHLLDLGFRLSFGIDSHTGMDYETIQDKYPDDFQIVATNNHGESQTISLYNNEDNIHDYYGRFTATHIEDATWSFSQPMYNWEPCNNDDCHVSHADLRIEALRPSLLEAMSYWTLDSLFVISALGVLVDQEETGTTNTPYTINTYSYDAFGAVENADVDIAVLRVSPQLGAEAAASLEPEGTVNIDTSSGIMPPTLFRGEYDGSDLDGDISVRIEHWGERDDNENLRQDMLNAEMYVDKSGSGTMWDATNEVNNHWKRGIVETTSSGTTTSGIEFEFWEQMPLPNSPGCMWSEASFDGGDNLNLQIRYQKFFQEEHGEDGHYERTDFDAPNIEKIVIDWGDGATDEIDMTTEYRTDADEWRGHSYDNNGENQMVEIQYELGDSTTYTHTYHYQEGEGFERTNEEEETSYEWSESHSDESWWDYCRLEKDSSSTPTPALINSFITDGPAEVLTEVISQSNGDGEVNLDVTPDLAGVYTSIVQTQHVRNGETFTGIGVNIIGITEGTVALGGSLVSETTFAGIPVYSATPLSSGLMEIEVTPSGISADNYKAIVAVLPLDLSVPFPDIDEDLWNDEAVQMEELEFQSGDVSRTQEVRVNAPLSLVAVMIMEDEDSLFPLAMSIGLLLTNPESLDLNCADPLDTSCLGPGQTANVALADSTDTTRILSVAAPKLGFDPASIDLSSFSEFGFGAVREDVGWIAEEQDIVERCEVHEVWFDEDSDWETGTESNVRMSLRSEVNEYVENNYVYTPNTVLKDTNGDTISPTSDWHKDEWEWEDKYHARYYLESGEYTLTTDSGDFTIEVSTDEYSAERKGDDTRCGEEEPLEEEVFAEFTDVFGNLNSVAWGQGSSADLSLPLLSAPNVPYTVIGIAQQGTGDSSTVIAALNNCDNNECVSEENPEEIVMQNLSVAFTPSNPQIGETVIISVVDESGFPVSGLSLIVTGEDKGDSYITNQNGQVAYVIPDAGNYTIYVGGGLNYNEVTKTIIVDSDGVQEQIVNEEGEIIEVDLQDGTDITGPIDDNQQDNEIDNQNNQNNQTTTTDDEDQAGLSSGLSAGLGDNMMLGLYAIGGIIIVLLVAVLVMRLRGRESNQWDDYDESSDMFDYGDGDLFGTPQQTYAQPAPTPQPAYAPPQSSGKPPSNQQGEMRDGYEVLEFPSGSGQWWFRDQSSGQWMEWR